MVGKDGRVIEGDQILKVIQKASDTLESSGARCRKDA